jgi:Na+-transporting NADH:ubiquinone oxidoreductase subunit NqrB
VLSTVLITQAIWILIVKSSLKSLKSALITGLGLSILLQTGSDLTLIAAGVLAISSKFIIRINNKHLFNPANFGIIAGILLFQDAWISPGQWGSDAYFLLILSLLGGFILFRIGRLDTSVIFLGSLFLLEFMRTYLYQGWGMDVLLHKFSSGTLLLFAFFMITDPMTIPYCRKGRVIWSLLVSVLTFALSNWIQIYTAPIWVIFFLTPLTVLIDKVYPSSRFEWNNLINKSTSI